jgi:sialate O-acetylesterase
MIARFSFLLALIAGALHGQAAEPDVPKLTEDYQVLQRDEHDQAACNIVWADAATKGQFTTKVTDATGKVLLSKTLDGVTRKEGGRTILIEKLPVGGPYTIEVRPVEAAEGTRGLTFKEILVGDLWVTSGQSNMYGAALPEEEQKRIPGVHIFDTQMLSREAHWIPAIPPIHRVLGDKERTEFKKFSGRIGPAESFARKLYQESGVPIGLIPCAVGASLDAWDPEKREQNHYGFILHHVQNAGGRIKGLLWAQGAQDAIFGSWEKTVASPGIIKPLSTYRTEFKKFAEALRRDVHNPDLVIISAQECRQHYPPYYARAGYEDQALDVKRSNPEIVEGESWERLREMQRLVTDEIPHMHVVPMVDLDTMDGLHLDYDSYKRLGHRMAWLALPYAKKGVTARSEIKLKSARWGNNSTIEVEFEGVTGKLTAPGRATGFQLRSPQKKTGADEDWIFKVKFDPIRPNVAILSISGSADRKSSLYYGAGVAPFVNITDENDMGLPAFGPVKVESGETKTTK